jgi:hypothetical protein
MSALSRNRSKRRVRASSGRGFQPRFESLEPRVMLAADIAVGDLEFKEYPAVVPTSGEYWFSMTSTQAGTLTAVAAPNNPGTPTLGLYDSMDAATPLATGTEDDGTWRIDYSATSGAEYFLKLGGTSTSVNMKLANLLSKTGTSATVGGTDGLDEYEFNAGASRVLTVNGIKYAFTNSELTSLAIDGEGGLNTVVLRDSPGDDTLVASPGEATLSNGDGDSEPNFSVTATGMADIQAYANAGGDDSASMTGSAGKDKLKGYADFARLRTDSGSQAMRAKNFDTVMAMAGGGKDVAVLLSTDLDDTFRFDGATNSAQIESTGRDITGKGFGTVVAYGKDGANDVAHLTDMPGDQADVIYFKGHKTELVAQDVSVVARAFDEVHGVAGQGGVNVARVYDTAGSDHFEFIGDTASVYRRIGTALDLIYSAKGFDTVKAQSDAGTDTVDEQVHTYELIKRGGIA